MSKSLPLRLMIVMALALGLLVLVVQAIRDPSNPYGQADTIASTIQTIRENYVQEPDPQNLAMLEAALDGMVRSLEDPHSQYMPKVAYEDFSHQLEGELYGIGARVDEQDGYVRIVEPMEGSPAHLAGLRPGDLITHIDGVSTQGVALDEAVSKIKGKEGTKVTLTVLRDGKATFDLVVTRGKVQVPSMGGLGLLPNGHPRYMPDPESKIGYIHLREFNRDAASQLKASLKELKALGLKGLVFDLRDNPGGLLGEAIDIVDLFLPPNKTAVTIAARDGRSESYATEKFEFVDELLPVVILINEGSASASEIVSGALKDHGRVFVVGTRSYGKGSVQDIFDISEQLGAMRLTIAKWLLPSGRQLQRVADAKEWGVDPSVGGLVPVTGDERMALSQARLDLVVEQIPFWSKADDVTFVDWLEHTLKDPQLAAGFQAVQAKLASGSWPDVSTASWDAYQAMLEIEQLEAEKQLLESRLSKLDQELLERTEQIDADETTSKVDQTDEVLQGLAP